MYPSCKMMIALSLAGYTLKDSKRNDGIRKELNVFSNKDSDVAITLYIKKTLNYILFCNKSN